jgi:DNA topoisomerase-3
LDLKVGIAFSRYQTRYFQGRYGDLNSAVLSYGPCQTPTLGFCVQRYIDIQTFKPEPYWVLELAVMKRGRSLRALWGSGRSFNKNKVEKLLLEALESGPFAKVTSVVAKDKKQGRPIPLNTVALLKACSKALGIGPHATLQTAERLYLSGYLSYPRTESSAYPKSFDIYGTLQQQSSDVRWGSYVRELLREGPNKSRGGIDMGDHPPITPCRATRAGELSGDMARVYDLVVRHFIASVSQDAVWRSTQIDFAIEALGEKGVFTLRGKEPVSPGFLAVLLHTEYGEENIEGDEDEEERALPAFAYGELIPLTNTSPSSGDSSKVSVVPGTTVRANLGIKEKMTTPPTYLTESELISLMEKNGIGTDASISTHIENVQKRNYVALESGRRLVPSKLGIVLAQGYHQIDSSLVLPRVRSDIEDECNKIAKGLLSKDIVVQKAIDLFRNKFDSFVNNISKMDVLFSTSFSKLEDVGKPFTRCGLTRRYLQFIEGPPPRLYNKWTETVYPLPSGGIVKQWTGRVCSVENCNFELCLFSVGNPQRTFPLCPRCVNDSKWSLDADELPQDPSDREDEQKEKQITSIAGKRLVLECPLPDEHPSIEELTVSTDPESDGVLILDPHMGPKWRLVSTRDPTIVYMPKGIEKITVLNKKDEALGVHLMQVDFKAGDSPFPDGELKYTSCFPEDEVLKARVRIYHGSDRLTASGRGGRGRGGRGGRARGRGRSGRIRPLQKDLLLAINER